MRPLAAVITALCVTGCASLALHEFDKRYGQPDPTRYDVPAKPGPGLSYRQDVQPILERRCVVCHACYDGPCQLKLTAWQGIARGTSKAPVYDATRLLEAPTTRLFLDAQLPSQWWERGFSPVLNNRTATPDNNLAASVLYRSLQLKREHPLPTTPILSKAFDFSLDRDATCPRIDEYENYAANQPLAGMPYGLPGLNEREFSTIQRWLAAGAPYEGEPPLSPAVQEQVRLWETFLNGDSNKERLMSRYLYEHLYLGTVYFEADPRRPMRLVRSATAPGQPPVLIATRRPYDDPGVARVYYRLVPERETIVAKTHMPYALGPSRMAKYRSWFLAPTYTVAALPSYDADGRLQSVRGVSRPAARRPLSLHARRSRVLRNELHQGAGVPRPARARRHRRPLLGVLRRSGCRRRCHGRRTARARTHQPAPARRMGQQLARADPVARILEARSELPEGEKRVARDATQWRARTISR